jgi:hypothetical protein
MRNLGILTISGLMLVISACGKPKTEDCGNNADDDGDGAVDCDDSECAADASCDAGDSETDCSDGADDDGDGDIDCDDADCDGDAACDTTSGPEVCDDTVDNDGDGNADCADSDCAGTVGCRVITWREVGTATVTDTSYSGTTIWTYDFLDPADGGNICEFTMDANDAGAPPDVACDGCDFAFNVEFTNSHGTGGDCEAVGLTDGYVDGTSYGYGFNPAYDYSGTPIAALMYYASGYGWYAETEATYTGDQFDYDWLINYYYY